MVSHRGANGYPLGALQPTNWQPSARPSGSRSAGPIYALGIGDAVPSVGGPVAGLDYCGLWGTWHDASGLNRFRPAIEVTSYRYAGVFL